MRVLSLEGLKGELPSLVTLFLCDLAPLYISQLQRRPLSEALPSPTMSLISLCLNSHPHLRPGPYRCLLFPPLSTAGPEGNFSWDGSSSNSKGCGVSSPTWGTLASHSPPSALLPPANWRAIRHGRLLLQAQAR